jgi:cytochrome c oxidase subunit IV
VETGFNKRLFAVWLILSGITVLYLAIDHSAEKHGVRTASEVASVSAIVLALVKVRIIMREFMEVREAPRLLCLLTDGLIVIMAVVLLGSYLIGRALA